MSTAPVPDTGAIKSSGIAGSQADRLPVTRRLSLAFASSLVIALLVAIVSVAGLLFGTSLYPMEEMLSLKQPTDLFTLVVALPLLLGSMWLARRGRLLGLLCWPGVLLYVLYVYVSYAIGVPFNVLFLAYVVLVALSAYTLIGLVASIDAAAVRQRLAGAVPERVAGGILVGLAILFTLMNLANVVSALTSPVPDHLLDLPVWFVDFAVVAPAWFIGGLLLWQRRALGYVAGAGLLLLGCMLFVGVIFALVFPAFYAGSPVDLAGIVLILVTGLICFIPFAFFVRGITKSDRWLSTS
ncbi:MAG: hypothetical protein PVG56_04115 [Anaerolineae bacterium]|jgi:hypothetical protein